MKLDVAWAPKVQNCIGGPGLEPVLGLGVASMTHTNPLVTKPTLPPLVLPSLHPTPGSVHTQSCTCFQVQCCWAAAEGHGLSRDLGDAAAAVSNMDMPTDVQMPFSIVIPTTREPREVQWAWCKEQQPFKT